jgi:hypothetical protein
MRTYIRNDLTDACDQPTVIEHGVTCRDAILTELSSVAEQAGGVGQRPNGHRSIISGHTAEFVTRNQSRGSTQVGRT